ncbi:hypothetical protein NM208_g61 [Fusarium decemcellulare]|uniref:Uncharacterized protein n=1 Tax=Fusarium decemcellulare TaxID=57161 RepID=A0ACC1T0V6_9HYPO|nr:hypothetical protein NM208_g61 [Fusarium decemcellulare]
MESNPFIVSWWPLALADPALFHVSIQTASLDEELRSQKGFPVSELLMMDSVSLVRQKVENSVLAYQDDTLNAVVTLAAIEHGKGNVHASTAHIEGVKRMVGVRGGINQVRLTSPLTARMIAWVSMLVTRAPQFPTQDDFGLGDGVGPIFQWLLVPTDLDPEDEAVFALDIDTALADILIRLRRLFHTPEDPSLSTTDLHDLTCFVVHRLLLLGPLVSENLTHSATSESLRHALALYMLIIHGTTYYSHADLANAIILQLRSHLTVSTRTGSIHGPLEIWILSVGLVSTTIAADRQWFADKAATAAKALNLHTWEDVLACLKTVLWLETQRGGMFRQQWAEIFTAMT